MKITKTFLYIIAFSLISFDVSAEINLSIKIGRLVGTETIETVRKFSAQYNQDIVVVPEGLKNKLVFNLKKFKDILVNGNRINPVQIDMKMVNETKEMVGKSQTVTSFYNNSAQFDVSNGMKVSLNFEEI